MAAVARALFLSPTDHGARLHESRVRGYHIHAICIGWVLFVCPDLPTASRLFTRMFILAPAYNGSPSWQLSITTTKGEPIYLILPFFLLALFGAQLISSSFKGKPGIMPIPARFRGFKAVYLACLASVLVLFCPEITPRFIYFQF